MTDFKREVLFAPAFDRRSEDPKKNCGVHGVEIRFLLTGGKGVVQFLIFTGWQLPHVQKEWDEKAITSPLIYGRANRPMAADIGYHSPMPMWEGQQPGPPCEFLGGVPCYYDGSSLQAEEFFNLLLTKGGDAVWLRMEDWYRVHFEPAEAEATHA